MRTDELIRALAADAGAKSTPPGAALAVALLGGAIAAAAVFFSSIGVRPDIAQVAYTVRFLYKFAFVFALGVPAVAIVARLGRPGAGVGAWGWALALAPLALLAGVFAELVSTPETLWGAKLIGANSRMCLTLIPMLAVAPLIAVFVALRHGAPTAPRLAGAMGGLAAASVGVAFYASHCVDDSPLFVATWYTIAIAIVAVIGAVLGPKILRW